MGLFDDTDDAAYFEDSPARTPARAAFSELTGRKHWDNLLIAHFTGTLGVYLYPLGYTTGDDVAKVQAHIEQMLPTLAEESDVLFQLMERELCQNLFGGINRLITDSDEEASSHFESVTDRISVLFDVRCQRLKLRKHLDAAWEHLTGGTATDGKSDN